MSHDDKKVEEFVSKADVVVSLLPYTFHVKVAEMCIKHKKQMITTSYVSDAMRALDKKAKAAGILILNECGLDPASTICQRCGSSMRSKTRKEKS